MKQAPLIRTVLCHKFVMDNSTRLISREQEITRIVFRNINSKELKNFSTDSKTHAVHLKNCCILLKYR